jgi:hypothetical protein
MENCESTKIAIQYTTKFQKPIDSMRILKITTSPLPNTHVFYIRLPVLFMIQKARILDSIKIPAINTAQ